MKREGNFIISLDFELAWGLIDLSNFEQYKTNILGVPDVIPRLLKMSEEYEVKLNFGIVGLLLCKNAEDMKEFMPALKPSYKNRSLNPYEDNLANKVQSDVDFGKIHFASDLVALLKDHPNCEIGSHTFCHYYCQEEGQTIDEFEADINSTIKIFNREGINLNSIIFPRNQANDEYLSVCRKYGILIYRGNEENWLHDPKNSGNKFIKLARRGFRLIDTYVNLTGHNCYLPKWNKDLGMLNLPASRFLKPYVHSLRFLDHLKLNRIKSDMLYAAENDLTYHLWWHPHNFGCCQEENFALLEEIFKYYTELKLKYGFRSTTFSEIMLNLGNK